MKAKKIVRSVCCALLALAMTGLTACSELFGGDTAGGTPSTGGNGGQTENGGSNGGGTPSAGEEENGNGTGDEENLLPILPVIPETPEEEEIVLPETLDFTPPAVTEQYGYRYFSEMADGEKYCRFYIALYEAACDLSVHTDVTVTTANLEGGGTISFYAVDTLNYNKYGLTDAQAVAVWKTFRMEYPEFYWLNNQVTYGGGTLNLQIFEEYALGATRAELKTKIEAMANDCFSYLEADMTATEMALTIYDYVIASTQYAYKSDGETPEDASWAHNLVGIADGGKGVCETYAKSFEYLCSLVGIDAITVGGTAGTTEETMGGHAWNIVKLDGVWYNVDATWGDGSTVLREWFGKSATEFATTHIADTPTDGYSIGWQYELPAISETTLSPVLMREADGADKMYACIDYAFADIVNAESEYTITLYPHTSVTTAKGLDINRTGASFTTSILPAASLISFIGARENVTTAELTAENAFQLSGDIYLKETSLTYPSIDYNGFSINKDIWSYIQQER